METVKILAEPQLRDPVAIIAFKGWANAGEVATSSVSYLIDIFKASPLARIEPDPYYDFTATRPKGLIKDGRVTGFYLPQNLFSFCQPEGERATILFRGEEPHLCWSRFIQDMLEVLQRFGVSLVVTVGGTYDERLHTDPPRVSVIAEEMVLAEGLLARGAVLADYTGPVSIHTALYVACREKGFNVVSLWAHAPVYVQTGNFSLVREVMELIAALGGPNPNLEPLDEAQLKMDQQIESLIKRSSKLANYIEGLRGGSDGGPAEVDELAKGTAKIIPLNRPRNIDHDD